MGVQWYVVFLSSENTFFLMRSSSNCSSISETQSAFSSSCCFVWRILLFTRHPPPLFSLASSHSSFSRLTAFRRSVQSSTALFLLHRKLARVRERSVSWVTGAPTGGQVGESHGEATQRHSPRQPTRHSRFKPTVDDRPCGRLEFVGQAQGFQVGHTRVLPVWFSSQEIPLGLCACRRAHSLGMRDKRECLFTTALSSSKLTVTSLHLF